MEPMSLGSPTSSPSSPPSWGYQAPSSHPGPPIHGLSLTSPPPYGSPYGGQQQYQHPQHPQTPQTPVQTQSGFLPGFLMGDPVLSPSTPHRPHLVSPTKLSRTLSSPAPQSPSVGPSGHPIRGNHLLKETLNRSTRTPGDKPSGPPTTGLMNSLNMTPRSANTSALATPGTSVFPGTPGALAAEEGEEASPLATWVTVWGFPPSAASYILQQFGACGTVLQHLMPPNSNWMHIRFQTRLQASKAIGRNSSVLGGSIMVGVAPCREEGVLEATNSSLTTSVLDSSVANLSSTLGGGGTPRTIRPLTQAYREAQEESKVVPGTNTPTRNTGLVSKAVGYMFGL